MKKDKNAKSRIGKYELPDILKGGVVYKALGESEKKEHKQYKSKYRRKLYKNMTELLGKDAMGHANYRQWFRDPENKVSGAFLERKQKNPDRWIKVTTAMRFALESVLAEAVHDARLYIIFHKEQNEKLSPYLNQFTNPEKQQ